MKYQVINIQEDVDYGCEEREVVLAVVTLQDENGNEITRKDPDQELYKKKIDKGSIVIIDENNKLQLALNEDWTKNCNTSNVDLQKFTDMMTKVKGRRAGGLDLSVLRRQGRIAETGRNRNGNWDVLPVICESHWKS